MQKLTTQDLEVKPELLSEKREYFSQRIILLQFLSLAAFSVSGLYCLVYTFYFAYSLAAVVIFIHFVLYFTSFVLIDYNRRTFSRHLMAVNFIMSTILHTFYLFPKEAGFQIYFIVGMPLIYMLFTSEQKIARVVYSIITVFALLLTEYGNFDLYTNHLLQSEQIRLMYVLNITTSILVLSIAIYIFVNILEKTEEISRLQAITDPLTQLFNRRHFFELSNQLLTLRKRNGLPLSLAFLDLDNFKLINDQHGHEVGDRVLQKVSNILKEKIRESDVVARFGGEEFIILFTNTDKNHALAVCEMIKKALEEADMPEHVNNITTSIGVSGVDDGDTINQVIKRADNALYEAKNKGRNQIVID